MILALSFTALLATGTALGQAGVGVNVGEIQIDETVAPGGGYTLPSIGVINTGHGPADYSLRITYRNRQEELEPSEDWFSFSPSRFHLEANESQNVQIKLELPVTAEPGDYFAFIEAYPVRAGAGGE